MGKSQDKQQLNAAVELRRKAEERLGETTADGRPPLNEVEAQRLVHELEVHQIELEMQNEELCRTRQELELSRDKYAELYDFAPVGYFVFDSDGLICAVNLVATQMLGAERQRLVHTPFAQFIADADGREIFSRHLRAVLRQQAVLAVRSQDREQGRDGDLRAIAERRGHQRIQGRSYPDLDRRRHGAQAAGGEAAAGP